jgi:cytochrome P450
MDNRYKLFCVVWLSSSSRKAVYDKMNYALVSTTYTFLFTTSLFERVLQTFLIGGTETSTTTVEWAMAELLKNPNLMKRVQDEIDAVVGRDRPVAEQDLSELKLLNAVIRETFRLHPNGPYLIPRQGNADCKVGGYDIPSNARILISIWGLHRDEDSWENPLEFIPERFLDQDRPLPYNGADHAFMPFGSGRRHCPGINLGVLFVQETLATLLHICDFSLPPGKLPEDIDFAEEPGVILVMKNPVEMCVSPRLAPEFYKTHMAGTE